jgi:hypothetical protein
MEDKYRNTLIEKSTTSEGRFYEVATSLGIKIVPQYKIFITTRRNGTLRHCYYADFCDIKHKMIFEVDGGYHNNERQAIKDLRRTRDLSNLGYRVFRITNEQVEAGASEEFICNAYLFIGIDIRRKKNRRV